VDHVSRADAIGAHKHTAVEPRAEQIDCHERRADRRSVITGLLAKQQSFAQNRWMGVTAHRMADYLGGDHSPQMMRRFSTITQRRTRVKVLGVVMPSPVVVAIE